MHNCLRIHVDFPSPLCYYENVILWHIVPKSELEDYNMKQLCKRSLAMLLLLVMLVGYFSGITIRASAASYIYNWGTREDVADQTDFTRSTAEEWYAAEGTSYEELSQYAGSATNSSVPSSALYQKLRSLMRGAVTDTTSYDDIKTLCQYTDCQNGGGKISSFYSGAAIGPSWDGTWNREHTWPNSKGDANGSGENDIFMVRPTTTSENSSRGNDAYGEGSSYYNPNEESGGTYDLRGDVARIILFVYVRWQDYTSSSAVLYGTSGVIESRAVLLKWMEEDPVDTWELGRNDSCQSITGTRNVFVDYPELAFLMLGDEIPDNYTSPSGVGSAVSYNITAQSNNTSYGTVSVSGKTITATPKTGYYASGYTVTSGSATVTQDGNKFTVSASSDCTIRINFAAKTAVTVSFSGANVSGKTGYAGESMSLPTVQDPEGYKFLGWMTAPLSSDTTEKPSYYTGSFIPNKTMTLYALYSYVDENTSGGTGDYVKVTSAPADWSGEYLIVNESAGLIFDGSLSSFDKSGNVKSVTINNHTISAAAGEPYQFVIAKYSNGYSIQGTSGMYFGAASAKNSLTTSTTELVNTVSLDSSGNAVIKGTGGYVLRYNSGDNRFRYYNNSQNVIALYVKDGSAGTTYYTTVIGEECKHTAVIDEAVEATCQSTGLTEGSHCADCGEILVAQTVIATVGCDFQPIVTPPTCTEQGYSTYTCIWCGEVDEVTDYVNATGHSFSAGVCTVCGEKEGKTVTSWNICLGDNIGVSFQLNVAQTDAVSFTVAGNTTAAVKNGNTYTIYLAAPQMTDEIVISVGGEPVEDTYSVRKYADLILAGEYTDVEKNLVKAMLCYGGAAQNCFAYHTGSLASAGVEMATAIPTGEKFISISDSLDGLDFCGASLVYRTKTAVRFYFSGSLDGLTFQIGNKEYTPVAKGDMYYVEVADINPQDIGETIEIVVSDGADTLTVGYSPLIYIVRMYEKEDSSEATKNLVFSLYNYYLAAVEYLAENS